MDVVERLPGRVSGRALVAFLAAVAVVPWLLPNQYLVHVAVLAGVYVILAVGLNLLMGFAGQVSLGHAGFYGLGAYVSAVLSVRYGLTPWLGMPIAALATGALAYVVGIPTLRLKSYYLGMATLGIGAVLHLAFVQLHRITGGSSGLAGILPWDLGPLRFTTATEHYVLVWAFAAVGLWVARNLVNARVGRVLRALRESEAAAEAMGVDTAAEKRRVFVLSAVYASVAGSLYAHYITVISPEIYSFLFSVVLVLMVAIGGIGLYWGAVMGAVLLTVLPEALRRFGDWEVPLYGLALIVVILFLPRGIAGLFAREGRALAPARSSTLPSSAPSVRASAPSREGRSGFFTEVLRIRQICNLLDGSGRVLFLFDELLSGTNSKDRRTAAEALVRMLVGRGAIGVVTTHDLALTEIATILPSQVKNVHLQDHVENGQMRFDYKLRDGVITQSNALELMRMIGLDV